MTTCTATYDVTELAQAQVHDFTQRRATLTKIRPFAKLFFFASYPAAWISAPIAGQLDLMARRLAQKAVWFRGARASLIESPKRAVLDVDGSLVDMLVTMENQLLEIRRIALKFARRIQEADGKRRGLVRDALRRLAAAGAEFYEEARDFRGALQAHDADREAASGRCATTPEEVDSALENLFHRG